MELEDLTISLCVYSSHTNQKLLWWFVSELQKQTEHPICLLSARQTFSASGLR